MDLFLPGIIKISWFSRMKIRKNNKSLKDGVVWFKERGNLGLRNRLSRLKMNILQNFQEIIFLIPASIFILWKYFLIGTTYQNIVNLKLFSLFLGHMHRHWYQNINRNLWRKHNLKIFLLILETLILSWETLESDGL